MPEQRILFFELGQPFFSFFCLRRIRVLLDYFFVKLRSMVFVVLKFFKPGCLVDFSSFFRAGCEDAKQEHNSKGFLHIRGLLKDLFCCSIIALSPLPHGKNLYESIQSI